MRSAARRRQNSGSRRICVRIVHTLLLLGCLTVPYICIPHCRAQGTPEEASDNQTLQVSFLSLNPGSNIAASRLLLRSGGTLKISIPGETLSNVDGTWSLQQNRFAASADFTIARRPLFHYRLTLNGFGVMGRCAGRARLSEYDGQGRLMQDIGFLFYAEAPGTRPLFGKNSAP